MIESLSDTARQTLLTPLLDNGWSVDADGKTLRKDFVFDDFPAAFAFMTRVAFYAEKWDHHPDWANSYNKVAVALTTHDSDALSALDARLARKMDQLV